MLVIEKARGTEEVELELGYVRGYTEGAMVTNSRGVLCVVERGFVYNDALATTGAATEHWQLTELRVRDR